MTTATLRSAFQEVLQSFRAACRYRLDRNPVHQFEIGRFVRVKPEGAAVPLGICRVLRTLPMSADDQPRYHVKCGADGLVRAMLEKHLEAAGGGFDPA